MKQQNPYTSNQFIELQELTALGKNAEPHSGNIIKNTQLSGYTLTNLELDTSETDMPAVIVKREGDVVKSIEFICSCGKKKIVTFEYVEGEEGRS